MNYFKIINHRIEYLRLNCVLRCGNCVANDELFIGRQANRPPLDFRVRKTLWIVWSALYLSTHSDFLPEGERRDGGRITAACDVIADIIADVISDVIMKSHGYEIFLEISLIIDNDNNNFNQRNNYYYKLPSP